MWDSDEQSASFRYEKPGASAIRRIDFSGDFIGVGVSLLDDVDLARATDCVDAMTLAVVEEVIGIAGYVHTGNYVARFRVQHDELRWNAASDK